MTVQTNNKYFTCQRPNITTTNESTKSTLYSSQWSYLTILFWIQHSATRLICPHVVHTILQYLWMRTWPDFMRCFLSIIFPASFPMYIYIHTYIYTCLFIYIYIYMFIHVITPATIWLQKTSLIVVTWDLLQICDHTTTPIL